MTLLIHRRVSRHRGPSDPPSDRRPAYTLAYRPQVPDYFFLEDEQGGLALHFIYRTRKSGESVYFKLPLVEGTLRPYGQAKPLSAYDRRALRIP